AAAIEEEDI
nr:Chain C, ALA-ALA-ALA-ILE-GLU-GLU-GLU-ASP-ILE [uncultured virus]